MSAGLSYRWVRIDVRSSNDHSEVEDVGCGVAGTADIPDDLTLGKNVFFDVCSILLIYLIVMKMVRSKRAALFGALLFALFPFEIMHSHYMRPHILGNTFVCLVIYSSLFIYEQRDRI